MQLRPEAEIKATFSEASGLLDTRIERVRNAKVLSDAEIKDFSNRSGFEPSGYPYFLWSYRVSYNFHHAGGLAMASLLIDYLEPIGLDTPREIRISQKAEIFNRGQPSFFVEKSERTISLADFLELDPVQYVWARLQESKQQILNQPDT